MADRTDNTNSGSSRDSIQAQTITGIVNLGGHNTVENCAVGDNASITVHADSKKKDRKNS